MRYLTLSLVPVLSALTFTPLLAQSQPAAVSATPRHQIGLIDMAHIFKNYEKFTALTEAWKKEVAAGDEELKERTELGKQLQEQAKTFEPGSPDFEKIESQLLTLEAEIKGLQRKKQRDLIKKEAEIFKATYLEVVNTVDRYARHFEYTLILRFDRSGLADAEKPDDVVNGLNQQVLFHRNRDDLTKPILDYLNAEWAKQQTAGVPPATQTR